MKIEAKLFEILTMFFILVAIIYGVFTALSRTGIEWAGLTAIVLSAGLTLIVGTYFRFVARRLDTRPEDYDDAEISDGPWLIAVAVVCVLAAAAGLVFEYYTGPEKH
eukprot:gene27027-32551_t